MIPGIAQAKDDSRATKARPSSPARLMIRSMRKAARDMYPTPSRKAMMRNMMMIWGTKVSTEPTPPIRPSPQEPGQQRVGLVEPAVHQLPQGAESALDGVLEGSRPR